MEEEKLRKMFSKILRPRCFGAWDCLINPNPANPFYLTEEKRESVNRYAELARSCPFILECMTKAEIKDPRKALQEWLRQEEYKKLFG